MQQKENQNETNLNNVDSIMENSLSRVAEIATENKKKRAFLPYDAW